MSFKIVTLNNITFDDVIESNINEPCHVDPLPLDPPGTGGVQCDVDPDVWAVGRTYDIGDRCYLASTHTIYKSRVDGNVGKRPDEHEWDGTTGEWYNDGYTNRYRMIDKFTNTYCEGTTTIEPDHTVTIIPIDFTINVGYADTICLFGVDADQCIITQTDNGTGEVTYSETIRVSREPSTSWWGYFFGKTAKIATVYRTIPHRDAKIRVQLSAQDRKTKIGIFVAGVMKTFGRVKYGVESSIIDYSKKIVDNLGYISLEPGRYARRFRCDIYLKNSECDYAMNSIIAERGVPAVYVVDENRQSLIVYGLCRNFSIYWVGPLYSKGVIEIVGLT